MCIFLIFFLIFFDTFLRFFKIWFSIFFLCRSEKCFWKKLPGNFILSITSLRKHLFVTFALGSMMIHYVMLPKLSLSCFSLCYLGYLTHGQNVHTWRHEKNMHTWRREIMSCAQLTPRKHAHLTFSIYNYKIIKANHECLCRDTIKNLTT